VNIQITSGGSISAVGTALADRFSVFKTSANETFSGAEAYSEIVIDASGGAKTFDLPLTSAVSLGRFYIITRGAGTNTITINRAGGDTINGATSFSLLAGLSSVVIRKTAAGEWIANVWEPHNVMNGATFPTAPTGPNVGQVLHVSAAGTYAYRNLDLSGVLTTLSGVLPPANLPVATSSDYGAIRVTGDISGAASPAVVGITGTAGVVAATAIEIRFAANGSITSASGATPGALTIRPGAPSTLNAAGVDTTIGSGPGNGTGLGGLLSLEIGRPSGISGSPNPMIQVKEIATNQRIVGIGPGVDLEAALLPGQITTGDGVIAIYTQTVPTQGTNQSSYLLFFKGSNDGFSYLVPGAYTAPGGGGSGSGTKVEFHGDALAAALSGGSTWLYGEPDTWLKVYVNGTQYRMPLFLP
jgi:hypothetical protein